MQSLQPPGPGDEGAPAPALGSPGDAGAPAPAPGSPASWEAGTFPFPGPLAAPRDLSTGGALPPGPPAPLPLAPARAASSRAPSAAGRDCARVCVMDAERTESTGQRPGGETLAEQVHRCKP